MTGGYEPNDDDDALFQPPAPDRPWQHPSEVGQAVRGRVDRRRSSVLATGLVLSGIGLLVTGVLIGQLPQSAPPAPTTTELAAPSLVTITAVDAEGASRYRTGVVLDDEGHLLVPAEGLQVDDDLWTRVTGGELRPAELVAADELLGIAVVRTRDGGGSGAVPALGPPTRTESLQVLQRVRKDVVASPAWVTRPPASPVVLTAVTIPRRPVHQLHLRPADGTFLDTGPVFDEKGRLVALVVESGPSDVSGSVAAIPARTAFGIGTALVER